MLKRLCITVIIVSIMFLCPLIASADGVNYLGEICLFLSEENSFAPASRYKLGVLSYGDGHFALNGDLGSGAARIDDKGMIIISLTGTGAAYDFPQPGSTSSSGSIHMVVDPSTLIGNFRVMGFDWKNMWETTEPPVPFTGQGNVDIYECN